MNGAHISELFGGKQLWYIHPKVRETLETF